MCFYRTEDIISEQLIDLKAYLFETYLEKQLKVNLLCSEARALPQPRLRSEKKYQYTVLRDNPKSLLFPCVNPCNVV